MKASVLFVKCLENENVEYVFGIPGEENIDLMDAFIDSRIRFITTRHEQGAAFMADVYGRLTGAPGVCLATLGPGATNLITGFADGNMDKAPIVAIAGQGATGRMHKESHQIIDLVRLFEPISKYSVGIRLADVIPEVVRKAFREASREKPGGCFMEFPEDIAKQNVDLKPLRRNVGRIPKAPEDAVQQAAAMLSEARFPLVLAGNGIVRGKAWEALQHFAEKLSLPVANTFMAKGVIPFSHDLSLGTVGLQSRDYVACGFSRADVIVCAGYDIVEYHPRLWNPESEKRIIHVDASFADTDGWYVPVCSVIGDIASTMSRIVEGFEFKKDIAVHRRNFYAGTLREVILNELEEHSRDSSFPLKPQKIVWDLRQALDDEDIVICDVGAHKMWMARMYQAERPNTCIISNGYAAMGISVPGALAAKLVYPQRKVVAVTGDAGFMMNSQEIETALRCKVPFVILIWRDDAYGLIEWHQMKAFNRPSNVKFTNPDFVRYAESFGAKGYRVEAAGDLLRILKQALSDDKVAVIDCPVDYSVNLEFTRRMGELVCPI